MESLEMLSMEQDILKSAPCYIVVGSKKYKVKQVSTFIAEKIQQISLEAFKLSKKQSSEAISIKEAKSINKKIYRLHSKTAAYYLLNNLAITIPFLFAITWRILHIKDAEHTFMINAAGSNNGKRAFFLGNWDITRNLLELNMKMVSQGIKQSESREESVKQMLREDLPINQDNK